MARSGGGRAWIVGSEFASVRVTLDTEALGDRVLITDLRTGRAAYFDPLELECLAWMSPLQRDALADPVQRWPDGAEDDFDEHGIH